MNTNFHSPNGRRALIGFRWAAMIVLLANAPLLAQKKDQPTTPLAQEKNRPALLFQALESDDLDRQHAALVLIPDLAVSSSTLSKHLERYLAKSKDDEGIAAALLALGKLDMPAEESSRILMPYLSRQNIELRRAAVTSVRAILTDSAARLLGSDGATDNFENIAFLTGSAAMSSWVRKWLPGVQGAERNSLRFNLIQFQKTCTLFLPLCDIGLTDVDDNVQQIAAESIEIVARAIVGQLPDAIPNALENRAIDPAELKIRVAHLQRVLAALDKTSIELKKAMASPHKGGRLAATQAAGAIVVAGTLARATRKPLPINDVSFTADPVPEKNFLNKGIDALLPALALALKDEMPEIRRAAIEALERAGPESRPYLKAIIAASTDSDLIVRWVATRTLGKLLNDVSSADNKNIIGAINSRLEDPDLDVRNAALKAVMNGGADARMATQSLLRIVEQGDPDGRVQAIQTLRAIKAEESLTVPVMRHALEADAARVRRAVVEYLGQSGRAAKEAVPELRRLLQDPDEDVRKETANAFLLIRVGR